MNWPAASRREAVVADQRGGGIGWTDMTVNPGIYGCAEVSPACANCYAAKMAHRLSAAGVYPLGITTKRASGVHWSGVVVVDGLEKLSNNLVKNLPKQKPGRVFVTSMSDIGLDYVNDDTLTRIFSMFALHPHLTFQVLTKRPARLLRWLQQWKIDEAVASDAEHAARTYLGLPHFVWDSRGGDPAKYGVWTNGEDAARLRQRRVWPGWPLPNVWIGCTVEDQTRSDERIPHLLQIPARVLFLSCEPLLGPLDLELLPYLPRVDGAGPGRIGWVIAGGESGHRARATDPAWFRSLRDQCLGASVPFFFKQWGEWAPLRVALTERAFPKSYRSTVLPSGEVMERFGRVPAGRLLDGVEWSQFPEGRP
jgi:protein gp37